MRKLWLLLILASALGTVAQEVEIVCTTDVHGAYFSHNYLTDRDTNGGLDRVASFLRQERERLGDRVIYIDNGDLLQGQPTAYYYNFEDTVSTHLAADVLRQLGCSVSNMGNHDVETGHDVYDRWISDCGFPVLGANIIDTATGKPYLPPYTVINRDNISVAILGMITPAIPCWLPENLWSGLAFDAMELTARHWIDYLRQHEKPDFIVGVFHSGQGGTMLNGIYDNAADLVASRIEGFDAVLCGHDHRQGMWTLPNESTGDSVLVLNAGSGAYQVAVLNLAKSSDGAKSATGRIEKMADYAPDAEYLAAFEPQRKAVEDYVNEKIGTISATICSAESLDGPCAFMDLVHELQLAVADSASISIAAPLAINAVIEEGDVTVRDMFSLYKYENLLYTMLLTGQEVKDLLEMSYDMWIGRTGATYNYDSAYGIIYDVDRSAPKGQRVQIISMADGQPFDLDHVYRVAINSYRGNGGGALLTDGSGIDKADLPTRIVASTDKDLRYYLIQQIRSQGQVTPRCSNNWKFIN